MHAIASPSQAISVLTTIRRTLAQCKDLAQIRDWGEQAEAVRHYLKAAALGLETQNQAAEVKLICERHLGQLLKELIHQGGDRKSKDRDRDVTLDDLGISRTQSSRWQRESALPEEDFLRYVLQANEECRELTSNGLLRLARVYSEAAKSVAEDDDPFSQLADGLENLARQPKRFACIYAEPPWSRGKTEIARLPQRLCNLPVEPVAAPQAHLHLWVPPESLEAGLAVLRAWGFRYEAVLVRGRTPQDYGEYWRSSHDMLLLGVRGRLPFRDISLPSWLDGRDLSTRGGADDFPALVARASSPPYLDLFGTTEIKGWTVPVSS